MHVIRRMLGVAGLAAAVLAGIPAQAHAQCDQLVVKYDELSYWGGAFQNCKRPNGPTTRSAIFECAWAQVPANDRTECLKARLMATEQTRKGIDSVAAHNGPPNSCDKLMVKYDGTDWWWGAFAPCKGAPGLTDRNVLFECAWSRIPANDRTDCFKTRLRQTEQTRRAIDAVAAANGGQCDAVMIKYDGSNWWRGAFDGCKFSHGFTDRDTIFTCATNQMPAGDKALCPGLVGRLRQTEETRRYIDRVAAANGAIANNFSTVQFTNCHDPRTGCTEMCDFPFDGSVPAQYFAPLMPHSLVDAPGPNFNNPPGHNIGANEGRLRADLRAVARLADPLNCSLRLAATEFAAGNLFDAQAYADLSVTGRRAFAKFRFELPNTAYCQTLSARPLVDGCPRRRVIVSEAALQAGCSKALDRAYDVANFLRTGQSLQANPAKVSERTALGWIAVSGEDDPPHRPVNVPSSDFPQFDIEVGVPAPLVQPPNPAFFIMPTRYVIAQSRPPQVPLVPRPTRWTVRPDAEPSIGPNAEVLLFIHGMDSRAEEANDIIKALFARVANKPKNLVVIAVDLPTSGYAENLDFDRVSPLTAIGVPKSTVLPLPVPIPLEVLPAVGIILSSHGLPPTPVIPPGVPIPDFHASGATPLLDFIENFVVRFVETLEARAPIMSNIKAVMGGSLGGNISFRLGRRADLPWLPAVVVWSPASIWDSLGEGADILKHLGPREAWDKAADRYPLDPNDLSPQRLGRRALFFGGWDQPILPLLIPAQSETWSSDYWRCKRSSVVAARLDRHETYDPRFLNWHWRLGAEQLLYSHQTFHPPTGGWRFLANNKRMLLACGLEDRVPFNDICGATMRTVPFMQMTPGRALYLDKTGHALDNERPGYWADQVIAFLGL